MSLTHRIIRATVMTRRAQPPAEIVCAVAERLSEAQLWQVLDSTHTAHPMNRAVVAELIARCERLLEHDT